MLSSLNKNNGGNPSGSSESSPWFTLPWNRGKTSGQVDSDSDNELSLPIASRPTTIVSHPHYGATSSSTSSSTASSSSLSSAATSSSFSTDAHEVDIVPTSSAAETTAWYRKPITWTLPALEIGAAILGSLSYLSTNDQGFKDTTDRWGGNSNTTVAEDFGKFAGVDSFMVNGVGSFYVYATLIGLSFFAIKENFSGFWDDKAFFRDGLRGLLRGGLVLFLFVFAFLQASSNFEIAENGEDSSKSASWILFTALFTFLASGGLASITSSNSTTQAETPMPQAHLAQWVKAMAAFLPEARDLSRIDMTYAISTLSLPRAFASGNDLDRAYLTLYHLNRHLYAGHEDSRPTVNYRRYLVNLFPFALAALGTGLNFNDIYAGAKFVTKGLGLSALLLPFTAIFTSIRWLFFSRTNLFAIDKMSERWYIYKLLLMQARIGRLLAEGMADLSATITTIIASFTYTAALLNAKPSAGGLFVMTASSVGMTQGTTANWFGMMSIVNRAMDALFSKDLAAMSDDELLGLLQKTLYQFAGGLQRSLLLNTRTRTADGGVVTPKACAQQLLDWMGNERPIGPETQPMQQLRSVFSDPRAVIGLGNPIPASTSLSGRVESSMQPWLRELSTKTSQAGLFRHSSFCCASGPQRGQVLEIN